MNDSRTRTSRIEPWKICIGLLVAYSPMYLSRLAGVIGLPWDWLYGPPSILLFNWIAVGGLIAYITLIERRGMASIRLVRPSIGDLGWATVFSALGVVISGIAHQVLPPPPSEGMDTLLALPLAVLVAIVMTAAITEEVLYRGYSIERLTELLGHRAIALVASFGLFIGPHLAFFGPHWLLYHGPTVVLIYILYAWRRNLWACMLMHLLGNLMILFPALGLA